MRRDHGEFLAARDMGAATNAFPDRLDHRIRGMVPQAGLEPARLSTADFESDTRL